MSTTRWPDRPATALAAACAILVTACSGQPPGPPVTRPIEVAAFQRLELRGAADLQIEVGPAHSLSIEGPQNHVDALKSRVEGDKLIIEDTKGWWARNGSGAIHLRVTTPALTSLSINGAAQADIKGLSGGDLALQIQGAGQIVAAGSVANLTATTNGAGSLELSALQAQNAVATLNGAGNIEVNVSGSLTATVNGVGSIEYTGNPAEVKTAMNGVGSIKAK